MSPNLNRRLLATYLRPEWPRAVLLGALLLAAIGLQLANPQIAKVFIDHAQAGEPLEQLVWIALLFLDVTLLSQVASLAETYVAETLGWRATNALRADLTRHVLELDASFHTQHTAGELIERIDGDVSAIADFFARFVVQVLGSCVFLVGVLVLVVHEDWRVGTVLILCALAAFAYMTRGGGFVAVRSSSARAAAADLSSYLEERLAGLVDIKANGADAHAVRGLHAQLGKRFRALRSSVMAGSLFNGVVGLVFVVGTGCALGSSAFLYGAGAISLGSVYVVFRYTGMLRQPLERLTRYMNGFLTATGAIERLGELLAVTPTIVDGPETSIAPGPLRVELDHVSFAYETEPVLTDISLAIEPGEILGLLGRTGSGKTTVSRLLFRLHDPSRGVVRLNGMDIRDAHLSALRHRIGLVTQDVQLFQATLRDNVTLFDRAVSDVRLRGVFADLGLDHWLDKLPDGLNTPLGAGGRGLSAGEAQLVALARVFLKDAGLIVLDEASSRLDPATERLLDYAMTRLLHGRTAIVIAHHPATVQRADRIAILENSQLVEFGWRAQLLDDPGSRFSRLCRVGLAEVLV